MAKLSSMVRRRREAAKHLWYAVEAHGELAVKGLEKRMAAVLEEGEPMPGVRHFLDVLCRMVVGASEELDAADSERWTGTLAVQSQRSRRNPLFLELRQKIVDLRDSLKGLYGARLAGVILGIKGRTPRGFEELLYYAGWLEQRLRTIELPPGKVNMGLDPVGWADELKPLVEALSESLDRVEDGGRGEEWAVVARNRKIGEFDADLGPITRLVESVYLLGGQTELSRRLRPSFRRPLVNRAAAMGDPAGQDAEPVGASGETGAPAETGASGETDEASREGGSLLRRLAPGLFRGGPPDGKNVC